MKPCSYCIVQPSAVLRVTGEDAPDYLQSQFSNDLRRPGVQNPATYGLWLDQKGKTRADSFVLQTGPERYLLVSYFIPAEQLQAIVEGNIIADEVEIEDLTGQARLVAFWGGDHALGLLPEAGTFEGEECNLCFHGRRSRDKAGEILLVKSDGESEESAFDAAVERWLKNRTGWRIVTPLELEAERVRSGIPAVPQDIGPGDLPQEGGLEQAAVSFDKGCYLGQEVMARLHAMGRAQRALYRVRLPLLPERLPAAVYAGEKSAGEVRSMAVVEGQPMGLALLKRRAVGGSEPLHLGETGGPVVEVLDDGG